MLQASDKEKSKVFTSEPKLLYDDLRTLVNNRHFSDVKFLIGDKRELVHAHKALLAARCEIFKKMFHDGSDSNEPYILSDVSPNTFLTLMEYLYTNSCTLESSKVLDVLSAASKFGLTGLVKICETYLSETITAESACNLLQIAVTFSLDDLKVDLLPVIEHDTQLLFKSKGFQEISADALGYILQSDNLSVDEIEIVAAVRNWATVNSVVLGQPISEIARTVVLNIRLALLSPEELTEVEKQNSKDRLITVEQISQAWKHLALKTPLRSTLETTPRIGTKERIR